MNYIASDGFRYLSWNLLLGFVLNNLKKQIIHSFFFSELIVHLRNWEIYLIYAKPVFHA